MAGVALGAAGVALALSARHGSPGVNSTSTAPPVTSVAVSGPPCPLTGAPAPGGEVPLRPALAVKVDNYPTARPQSGLDQADVVFEEPVEGGITRLAAVFQCQGADLVGPIRSARAVDVPILDQLSRPLFIHAGGIAPVLGLLRVGNLLDEDVFTHGQVVDNPSGRVAPYDTYVSTAAAWGLDTTDRTPPEPLFTYATSAEAGQPVTQLHIPFSPTNDTTWRWDQTRQRWLLSYSGTPATVADGTPVAAADIVVERVQVSYGPWAENSEGGLEVQSKLTGSGPLLVLRNGQEISGTWQRSSLGDVTTLTAADGTVIALAPGPTWVEIVPVAVAVTVSP
ncbi:MAG TPA: DUF3048 domain-containing protein [Acidimicrobiales bacterium]|nr:DUF3048 domain-containing protein [Acidimicrobiales bacterium]